MITRDVAKEAGDPPVKRRRLSFRTKLLLLIMTVAALAIVPASAVVVYRTVSDARDGRVEMATLAARGVADRAAEALRRSHHGRASEAVLALRLDPDVDVAAIYRLDGTLYTSYVNANTPPDLDRLPRPGSRIENDRLHLAMPIRDSGENLGTLYVRVRMDTLYARAWRSARTIIAVMAWAMLVAFVLATRLQPLLTRPVKSLYETARTVSTNQDYRVRAVRQSGDELGELTIAFNEMLDEIQKRDTALEAARRDLEQRVIERTRDLQLTNDRLQAEIQDRLEAQRQSEVLHRELLDVSRQAGMAEVATAVLHDVGNVLNGVNVSASVLSDKLRRSRVARLEEVSGVLLEAGDDTARFLTEDERGQHLGEYIGRLGRHLIDERDDLLAELARLRKQVDHVKVVVSMQQNYARTRGLVEDVSVPELVDAALTLAGRSLHPDIEIHREFGPMPVIRTERAKVLQLLVNVIANAGNAMEHDDDRPKHLTVRAAAVSDDVRIEIEDTGVGIAPDTLGRIFAHGFTTRPDGHGFGLHHSALFAKELGGSLGARSDGPGQGAVFTLTLPAARVASLEAA